MKDPILLAVLGDPVDHSLSPRIHSAFGEQCGIKVDYRKLKTSIEELPERLKQLADQGASGVSLTVPLKASGIRACRQIDAVARRARAVNTMHWHDGGWSGYNTDGPGLLMDLDRLGINLFQQRVLILGAGGASAGVIAPLLDAKPAKIAVLNRTAERATALAERYAHLGPIQGIDVAEAETTIRDYDVLIQSTSAGHSGQLPPLRRHWLSREASVYDLNYGPAHSPLKRWAEAYDLACHDGLGMLVGQAALAFRIWTGYRPAMQPVLDALPKE